MVTHKYHKVATWIKFKGNGFSFSSFSTNGIPEVWVSQRGGGVIIGDRFSMNNGCVDNVIGFCEPCSFQSFIGKIFIGVNVGISQTTLCAIGANITIGDNSLLGAGVKLYTTDFHSLNYLQRRDQAIGGGDKKNRKVAPVTIGHDCFIGAGSMILKGVTIGDYSIIGAGSVVTKSVPSGEIWAGNPARFIKKLEDPIQVNSATRV